jgi:hypothetical protein
MYIATILCDRFIIHTIRKVYQTRFSSCPELSNTDTSVHDFFNNFARNHAQFMHSFPLLSFSPFWGSKVSAA